MRNVFSDIDHLKELRAAHTTPPTRGVLCIWNPQKTANN